MTQDIDKLQRRREISAAYARRNRGKINARRRTRARQLVLEAKTGPCTICGEELPAECMHLDHVRDEKLFTIGSWWHTVGRAVLEAEIAKCDRVCPNCHALVHFMADSGTPLDRTAVKVRREKGRTNRHRS